MDETPTPPGRPDRGGARLAALSDGVFAIAMTLLVLDLSVPPGLSAETFHAELRDTLPNLGAYALSFAVLAQFWRDQHYVLTVLPRLDSGAVHLVLLGLGLIALVPFPTALLAEYGGTESVVVVLYAAAMAAINGVHLVLLWRARRARAPEAVAGSSSRKRARPRVPGDMVGLAVLDMGATAALFATSIPLALLSPGAGMLLWALILPFKWWIGSRQTRAARTAPGEADDPASGLSA
ncbi:TMEM175 family protein [Streptomyces alkaliphilus]|uniref:TMEM175 family protein n=1 Tax=Streptomyces alkaliphilus TaxID=1472722 RepID=UPI0034D1BD23